MIGWFDGDVTKLFKIAPKDEAERLVQLMGGKEKVVAAAKKALEENEYALGRPGHPVCLPAGPHR